MSEKMITQVSLDAESAFLAFAHTLPVNPTEPDGATRNALSMISFQKEKKLPFQLLAIHAQNPAVLPALIEELSTYPDSNELTSSQQEMLQFILTALRTLAAQNLRLKKD